MQVTGKLNEHKIGEFEAPDGKTIAYDNVQIWDDDVPAEMGVERVPAKIKPPRKDADPAHHAGYARLAAVTPGTLVVVTVGQDKGGSLRYRGHDLASTQAKMGDK